MIWNVRMGLSAAIVLACLVSSLAAQPPAADGRQMVVSGAGVVTLRRPPTALGMNVTLSGKGKDAKQAMGSLQDRREAARLLLKSLKADMDSVKFSDPYMADAESDQRNQFEQMVRARVTASAPLRRPRRRRATALPALSAPSPRCIARAPRRSATRGRAHAGRVQTTASAPTPAASATGRPAPASRSPR